MHALNWLGWSSFFDRQITEDERAQWTPARVVWEGRERYRLSTGEAECLADLSGRLRHAAAARADFPVIGDWVLASLRLGEGKASIQRVLARRTRLARGAAGRLSEQQVVAANVDTVLLVTSCNRDWNPRRMERYLALAWESGATVIVVVNKADLTEDPATWRPEIAASSLGVPILVTSALTGDGIAALREVVRAGGTTTLVGSSGVGKSTLVNALLEETCQEVKPIRERDDRGRHSTTARQLFCVPGGGVLIDTPGMRELQLWDAEEGLEQTFADVQALANGCRFRDCSHGAEPGCAVADAISRGALTAERLENYRRLQREERFQRSRHDEHARQERTRRAKHVAKALKLQDKLRGR